MYVKHYELCYPVLSNEFFVPNTNVEYFFNSNFIREINESGKYSYHSEESKKDWEDNAGANLILKFEKTTNNESYYKMVEVRVESNGMRTKVLHLNHRFLIDVDEKIKYRISVQTAGEYDTTEVTVEAVITTESGLLKVSQNKIFSSDY